MKVHISATAEGMGRAAAEAGAAVIRQALDERGKAFIIVATGASQFEVLKHLVAAESIDWTKVTVFHLDEYVGLPISHPASFRKYLKERFADQVPQPVAAFHYIDGEGDVVAECKRIGELIGAVQIDVAFVGIGENCHLAFNDPPADFATEEPYIPVLLDEDCRKQQFGEGWFDSLEDVPKQAISMSIKQILKSKTIVCSVPDERKAKAVHMALEGPVTPNAPASILHTHPDCQMFLDEPAASALTRKWT